MVLKCQVKDHEDSSLQWSNPAQQTLYFGEKRGTAAGLLSPGELWARAGVLGAQGSTCLGCGGWASGRCAV